MYKQKKTYGIIGTLYNVLKDMNYVSTQTDFFNILFSETIPPTGAQLFSATATARAIQFDHYTADSVSNLGAQLRAPRTFKDKLNYCLKGLKDKNENKNEIITFLNKMQEAISGTTEYVSKIVEQEKINKKTNKKTRNYLMEYRDFSSSEKEQLEKLFHPQSNTQLALVDYIYLIIYWSVLKELPPLFTFEVQYQTDLNEFNSNVICKYGLGSVAGKRALMQLAYDGNIFALYELGNMYYYGHLENHRKDYSKALMYFRQAAGLSVDESINDAKCNPLALWIVAYMYINYQEGVELKDAEEDVYEIKRLQPNDRKAFAIRYCKHAVQLNNCVPALNLLGLISNRMDQSERDAYQLSEPEEYFKKAAAEGYVYAYNNLSKIEAGYIVASDENLPIHVDKYINYLTTSADEREPWACKKLGLFYYDGVISYNDKSRIFQDKIDHKKSLHYFETAVSLYSGETIAWSYVYMMVYFPEKYASNLPLLEEALTHCCNLQNRDALKFLCENIHRTCISKAASSSQMLLFQTLNGLDMGQELLNAVADFLPATGVNTF